MKSAWPCWREREKGRRKEEVIERSKNTKEREGEGREKDGARERRISLLTHIIYHQLRKKFSQPKGCGPHIISGSP